MSVAKAKTDPAVPQVIDALREIKEAQRLYEHAQKRCDDTAAEISRLMGEAALTSESLVQRQAALETVLSDAIRDGLPISVGADETKKIADLVYVGKAFDKTIHDEEVEAHNLREDLAAAGCRIRSAKHNYARAMRESCAVKINRSVAEMASDLAELSATEAFVERVLRGRQATRTDSGAGDFSGKVVADKFRAGLSKFIRPSIFDDDQFAKLVAEKLTTMIQQTGG